MGPILEIGTADSTGEIGQKKNGGSNDYLPTKRERKNADNDSYIGTKWSIILSTIWIYFYISMKYF